MTCTTIHRAFNVASDPSSLPAGVSAADVEEGEVPAVIGFVPRPASELRNILVKLGPIRWSGQVPIGILQDFVKQLLEAAPIKIPPITLPPGCAPLDLSRSQKAELEKQAIAELRRFFGGKAAGKSKQKGVKKVQPKAQHSNKSDGNKDSLPKFPGLTTGFPIRFGKSTVFTSPTRKLWRVKPGVGSRVTHGVKWGKDLAEHVKQWEKVQLWLLQYN